LIEGIFEPTDGLAKYLGDFGKSFTPKNNESNRQNQKQTHRLQETTKHVNPPAFF